MWWKGKAGPCSKVLLFLALLFGEATADLTLSSSGREQWKQPTTINNAQEQATWNDYVTKQSGITPPRLLVVDEMPQSYYSNGDANEKQVRFLDEAFDKRAPIMSSKALGLVILGSTILASTAAIRHMTHMHILPPSIRKTFGIEDDPVKPGVYKITQEELKALEALEEKAQAQSGQLNKRDSPEDDELEQDSSETSVEKRAMFPEKGLSGASVAKYAALAGLGGYLLRAWQHPPAPPQYYRKREVKEDLVEPQMTKRSPTIYSYPKAAGLIGLAGFAGWLSQVYGHEAKDQYPNGRREISSVESQGGNILLRRDNDDLTTEKTFEQLQGRDDASGASSHEEITDASTDEEVAVIDGAYKIDEQSNSASSRLKEPNALFWQILLISLATIVFLTSSTQGCSNEDNDYLGLAEQSRVGEVDGDATDPIKRSNSPVSSLPYSPESQPYVPFAERPCYGAQNDKLSSSLPQSDYSRDNLERFPPWDGAITRQDHREAHQLWTSPRFHKELDDLVKKVDQTKLSKSNQRQEKREKTRLARKLQAGDRHMYQQSPAIAPSPQHNDDKGNNYDFTKYPDHFNHPHLKVPESDANAAPSPTLTKVITESDRHKFKLDMGSFGVGIASTIGAEVAYMGAMNLARNAKKTRLKTSIPVEKSQSPVESVHRQESKEDQVPLSEGTPSSSLVSPKSQRMPGPSFKETRRRLSLTKRDINETLDSVDDNIVKKRSYEGNSPAQWSGHGASSSGNPILPPLSQYAEVPSWSNRPYNLQHLTEEQYAWVINKEAGGYESEEEVDTSQQDQSSQRSSRKMLSYSTDAPAPSRHPSNQPPAYPSEDGWPSFKSDVKQGVKITGGIIGVGAGVYGGTVGSIAYAKKLKRDRKKQMEALRIRPLTVEPEDYVVPPVQDIEYVQEPQVEGGIEEWYPEKRHLLNSTLVKRSSPSWNAANSISSSEIDWPSMTSLSHSLPYESYSRMDEQSWENRPLNLQDMPRKQYDQLMEQYTRGVDANDELTQLDQAAEIQEGSSQRHHDKSRKSGRKMLSKSAEAPGPSTGTDDQAVPPSSATKQADAFTMGDLASVAIQAGTTFGVCTGAASACLQRGVNKCRRTIRQSRREAAQRTRVAPGQDEEANVPQQQVIVEENQPVGRDVPLADDVTIEAPRLFKRSLTPLTSPSFTSPTGALTSTFSSSPMESNLLVDPYLQQMEANQKYVQYLESLQGNPIESLDSIHSDQSGRSLRNRKSQSSVVNRRKMDVIAQGPSDVDDAVGTGSVSNDYNDNVSSDMSLLSPSQRRAVIAVSSIGIAGFAGCTAYLCHQVNNLRRERRNQEMQIQPLSGDIPQVEGVQMQAVNELPINLQPVQEYPVKRSVELKNVEQVVKVQSHLCKRSMPPGVPDHQLQSEVPSLGHQSSAVESWQDVPNRYYAETLEYMNRPVHLQGIPAEQYYKLLEAEQADSQVDDPSAWTVVSKAKADSRVKSSRRVLANDAKVPAQAPIDDVQSSSSKSHDMPAWKKAAIASGMVGGIVLTAAGCNCIAYGKPCCFCADTVSTMEKRNEVQDDANEEESVLQKRSSAPPSPFGSPDQMSQGGGHIPYFDLSGTGDWRHSTYSGHPDDRPEYLDRPINLQGMPFQHYHQMVEEMNSANLNDETASTRREKSKSKSKLKKQSHRRMMRDANDDIAPSSQYDQYEYSAAPAPSSGGSSHRNNWKLMAGGAAIATGVIGGAFVCSQCSAAAAECCCDKARDPFVGVRKGDGKKKKGESSSLQKRSLTPTTSPFGSPIEASLSGHSHVPYFDLSGSGEWRHNSYSGHPNDTPEYLNRPINLQGLPAQEYYKMIDEMQSANLDEQVGQSLEAEERKKSKSKQSKFKSNKKSLRRQTIAAVSKKGGGGGGGGHGGGGGGGHGGGGGRTGGGSVGSRGGGVGEEGRGANYVPRTFGGGNPASGSSGSSGPSGKEIGIAFGVTGGVVAGAMLCTYLACGDPCCLCGGCEAQNSSLRKRSIDKKDSISVIDEESIVEKKDDATRLFKRSLTPTLSPFGSPDQFTQGGGHIPHFDLTGRGDWRRNTYTGHPDDAPEWTYRESNLQHLDGDSYRKLKMGSEEEVNQLYQGESHPNYYEENDPTHSSSSSKPRSKGKDKKSGRLLGSSTAGGAAGATNGATATIPLTDGGDGTNTEAESPSDAAKYRKEDRRNTYLAAGSAAATLVVGGSCIVGAKVREKRRQKRMQLQREQELQLRMQQGEQIRMEQGNRLRMEQDNPLRVEQEDHLRMEQEMQELELEYPSPRTSRSSSGSLHKRSTPPTSYSGSSFSHLQNANTPIISTSSTSWTGHPDDAPEYTRRPINMQDLSSEAYQALLSETWQDDVQSTQEDIASDASLPPSNKGSSSRRMLRNNLKTVGKAGGGGGGRAGGAAGGGSGAGSVAGEEDGSYSFNPYLYNSGNHGGAQGPSNQIVQSSKDVKTTAAIVGGSVGATLAVGSACIIGKHIKEKRRKKKEQLEQEQQRHLKLEQDLQELELRPSSPCARISSEHMQKRSHPFVKRRNLFDDDDEGLDLRKRAAMSTGAPKMIENGIVLTTSLAAAAGGYAAVNAVFNTPEVVAEAAKKK